MPESKIKNQKSKIKNTDQKLKTKVVAKSVVKVSKKKIEEKLEPTKKRARASIKVNVYDIKGKVVETINLPKDIFGVRVNEKLLAQAVRVYLANQRTGTASTKTRGEVKGSTRKIYRQKGTGRARHGAIRAPIFVHGGVAFGPKPRDYSLKLPKKMKKKALYCALSAKVKDGEVKIVTGLEKITPKTKKMVEIIKNLKLNSQKLLIVLPEREENIDKAARNIEGVGMILANQLNTYEVLNSKTLLFTKSSIEAMKIE